MCIRFFLFFFQAEDGIRDTSVTGVQTCALPISEAERGDSGDVIHVLFSAHSLPLKIVERGDPYPEDVRRTIEAVTEGLNHRSEERRVGKEGRSGWGAKA